LGPEDRGIGKLTNAGNCLLVDKVVYHKFSFFLSLLLLFEVDSRDGRTDGQTRVGLYSIDCWMDGHRQADTHCDWYTKLERTFILT
jgi:hypothetical protein